MKKPKKFLSTCLLFSLASLWTGCATLRAPADQDAAPLEPINATLILAEEVVIDSVSVNGARPPEKAWKKALRTLEKNIAGELVVNEMQAVEVPASADGHTMEDVKFKTQAHGKHHFAVVFMPKHAGVNRGEYRLFTDDRQMIIYDQAGIEATAMPLLSKAKIWEIVLFHEMAHAFSVPQDSSRLWRDNHCTNAWCVLYPKVDIRSVLSVLFHGYPVDFCGDCKSEIRAVREGVKKSFKGDDKGRANVPVSRKWICDGMKSGNTN